MRNWLVILVHGFNVYDGGRQSTAKLRPFFAAAGIPYLMLEYKHWNPISSRNGNDKLAKQLTKAAVAAQLAGYTVVALGHSNGCAIIHRATTTYHAPIIKAIYINPALVASFSAGHYVEECHIWHSPSDSPVQWAKWLPYSAVRPWGEMGAIGYTGVDQRCINHNKQTDYRISSKTHSDVFKAEKLAYFGRKIVECVSLESSPSV